VSKKKKKQGTKQNKPLAFEIEEEKEPSRQQFVPLLLAVAQSVSVEQQDFLVLNQSLEPEQLEHSKAPGEGCGSQSSEFHPASCQACLDASTQHEEASCRCPFSQRDPLEGKKVTILSLSSNNQSTNRWERHFNSTQQIIQGILCLQLTRILP
jgi:hypothetical protein